MDEKKAFDDLKSSVEGQGICAKPVMNRYESFKKEMENTKDRGE